MIIAAIAVMAATCLGSGYLARIGVQRIREDNLLRRLAEAAVPELPCQCGSPDDAQGLHGPLACLFPGLTPQDMAEGALSGPLQPDIDGADPFGDPPDDDLPGDDLEPSRAEIAWAAKRIIRDREDPAYWLPDNQHARRILREAADPDLVRSG